MAMLVGGRKSSWVQIQFPNALRRHCSPVLRAGLTSSKICCTSKVVTLKATIKHGCIQTVCRRVSTRISLHRCSWTRCVPPVFSFALISSISSLVSLIVHKHSFWIHNRFSLVFWWWSNFKWIPVCHLKVLSQVIQSNSCQHVFPWDIVLHHLNHILLLNPNGKDQSEIKTVDNIIMIRWFIHSDHFCRITGSTEEPGE